MRRYESLNFICLRFLVSFTYGNLLKVCFYCQHPCFCTVVELDCIFWNNSFSLSCISYLFPGVRCTVSLAIFESVVLNMLEITLNLFLHPACRASSNFTNEHIAQKTTKNRPCLKSFNIIHNILHCGNNILGLLPADEQKWNHCERVDLRLCPLTAQECSYGAALPSRTVIRYLFWCCFIANLKQYWS